MRYFRYYEPDNQENIVEVIMSEDDVRNSFYPYWKEQALKKKGNEVDLSFDRCLEEWICIHWAKEKTALE